MSEKIEFENTDRIPASVLNACIETPWMIFEESLRTILAIVNRTTNPEMVPAKLGSPVVGSKRMEVRGQTAIIPVIGPIFRYANLFTEISGATSIQQLSLDFQSALENPRIENIVLNIDSPGGQANGVSEFAEMVFKAREKKNIIAYIDGMGASAAYWIASAAEKIVASNTAIIGSIGTVISITDERQADEKRGVRTYELVSRKTPLKRVDVSTAEGQNEIYKMLDTLTEIFIKTVGLYRSYTPERVESDFGRGGVVIGEQAVAPGMIDAINSFENLLSDLENQNNNSNQEFNMAEKITIEQVRQETEILATLKAEGAAEERNRIKAIEESAVAGYEEIVQAAKWDGKSTQAEVALKILAAEKEKMAKVKAEREADAAVVAGVQPEGEDEKNAKAAEMVKNISAGMAKVSG